jgi:hypothetical protein
MGTVIDHTQHSNFARHQRWIASDALNSSTNTAICHPKGSLSVKPLKR